jgi:hypothetical protein
VRQGVADQSQVRTTVPAAEAHDDHDDQHDGEDAFAWPEAARIAFVALAAGRCGFVSGNRSRVWPIADDMESLAANGRKAQPAPAVETRHCDGCDADFRPARPWSRFCCPACRLRAHRRLAGDTRAQKWAAIYKSDPQ